MLICQDCQHHWSCCSGNRLPFDGACNLFFWENTRHLGPMIQCMTHCLGESLVLLEWVTRPGGEHKEWVIIIINESWLSHHFDFNQYASKSTKLTPPLFHHHHHQQHRSRYHDHHCYQPTLLPGEALVHCWVGSLLTPPPPFPYSVGGGQITTIIAITTIFAMTLPLVQLLFITIALALSFYAKKRFSQTVQFCSGEEEADQNIKLRVRY